MNWKSLVDDMRAKMTSDATCKSCGHHFENERDIQIEHILPPRPDHVPDLAREHARNLVLLCTSCNTTKSNSDFSDWLDAEEDARISNDTERHQQEIELLEKMMMEEVEQEPPFLPFDDDENDSEE